MSDRSSVARFPRWARVLDIITVAATLLALTVFITGGFREWTPVGRVSITSWIRPLVLALMCLIGRHALRPRPILPALVYRGVRTWWTASEARSIWATFVATRVGVYAIGFSFPVVPMGKARIRTQMCAGHEREQLDRAVAAFVAVGRELGVIGTHREQAP